MVCILFLQQTFSVSKHVRTHTSISEKPVSIACAAVHLAKQCVPSLERATTLLIGAGDTIRLTAQYLKNEGVKAFFVANRTPAHAEKILPNTEKHILPITDIAQHIGQMDIVITATACPLPFITRRLVEDALVARQQQALFLVDLAVPRDIEATVGELPHVHLYNIDDLHRLTSKHLNQRQLAAKQAEHIIEQEIERYRLQQKARLADDAIRSYRHHMVSVADKNCQEACEQIRQGHDPETIIRHLSHSLVQKFLHQPSERLRQAACQEHNAYLSLIHHLFSNTTS